MDDRIYHLTLFDLKKKENDKNHYKTEWIEEGLKYGWEREII